MLFGTFDSVIPGLTPFRLGSSLDHTQQHRFGNADALTKFGRRAEVAVVSDGGERYVKRSMYILLEYAGCVLLISVVAAMLFSAWIMALIIKEGGRVLIQASRKIINNVPLVAGK